MEIDEDLIRRYPLTIRPLAEAEGGGFWIAYQDLPGCCSDGATQEEALRNGHDAVKAYLLACLRYGEPIPLPGSVAGPRVGC
jgi:antitoxin HicB